MLGWVNQRTLSPGCNALIWAIHVSFGGVGMQTSSTSLLRPLRLWPVWVGAEVMVMAWGCFLIVVAEFSGLGEWSRDGAVY